MKPEGCSQETNKVPFLLAFYIIFIIIIIIFIITIIIIINITFNKLVFSSRVWRSHSGCYEEFHLLVYNAM
jgi:hypothetical protein